MRFYSPYKSHFFNREMCYTRLE